jgi:small subunit ribosomal protein S20
VAEKSRPKRSLSVLKRARQNKVRRLRNFSIKSKIKTLTRRLENAIASGVKEDVAKSLREVIRALGKAASKGVLHANTSGRGISRLTMKANSVLRSQAA